MLPRFQLHSETKLGFDVFDTQRNAGSSSEGTEDSDFSAEHTDSSESDVHTVRNTRLTRSSLRLSRNSQGKTRDLVLVTLSSSVKVLGLTGRKQQKTRVNKPESFVSRFQSCAEPVRPGFRGGGELFHPSRDS